MRKEKIARPFGIRDKIGYLFGDFGNDFTFILSSSFLLKFYTDVMGVAAGVVGIVMMAARFVDSVTDVAMGRICDRSKVTKTGKFKPWLLRMCGPVAIASFLMYQSSLASASMTFKIIWLFITYILWGSVFYTSINIPYGSMASAISAEPGDRQSLSTFRTMGGMFAGAIVSVGVPLIVYDKVIQNGVEVDVMNGGRFTIVAGVFSVLAVLCYALCFALTTERVQPEVKEDVFRNNSVRKMLSNAFKNRALISIIVASIFMLLAQLTMQTMANYVYPNYYNNAAMQSVSFLVMALGMIISGILAKPLAKRFGKAEIGYVSSFFAAFISFLTFFIKPQNVWVFTVLQAICWLGLGLFAMISWALITDVIDHAEIVNGIREDGSVYALYSFARKLGQAASAGLTGGLLSLIGYTSATAFDPNVKDGIFAIATLLPAFGFLVLGLVLLLWYPLHKKQVERNVATLKEKHSNNSKVDDYLAKGVESVIDENVVDYENLNDLSIDKTPIEDDNATDASQDGSNIENDNPINGD